MTEYQYPKIFISYSHETEQFDKKILKFSNKLRTDYFIDSIIDQYVDSPPEGWPLWMERQIEYSDYVLIVCTKSYFEKIEDIVPKRGKGAIWEIGIVRQAIYDSYGMNHKFIPVIFEEESLNYIPKLLKGTTYYNISKIKDLKKLNKRIHGFENTNKSPIGRNGLEALKQKTIFVPPVINNALWDKAFWYMTSYLSDPNGIIPTKIILAFKEDKAAVWIFEDLAKLENDQFIDALQLTFIKGQSKYWLKIGINAKYFKEYLAKNNVKESLIVSQYRYSWFNVDPYTDFGFIYLEESFKKLGYIEMAYMSKESHLNIVLKIRNVIFKEFKNIGYDDNDFEIVNNVNAV